MVWPISPATNAPICLYWPGIPLSTTNDTADAKKISCGRRSAGMGKEESSGIHCANVYLGNRSGTVQPCTDTSPQCNPGVVHLQGRWVKNARGKVPRSRGPPPFSRQLPADATDKWSPPALEHQKRRGKIDTMTGVCNAAVALSSAEQDEHAPSGRMHIDSQYVSALLSMRGTEL